MTTGKVSFDREKPKFGESKSDRVLVSRTILYRIGCLGRWGESVGPDVEVVVLLVPLHTFKNFTWILHGLLYERLFFLTLVCLFGVKGGYEEV